MTEDRHIELGKWHIQQRKNPRKEINSPSIFIPQYINWSAQYGCNQSDLQIWLISKRATAPAKQRQRLSALCTVSHRSLNSNCSTWLSPIFLGWSPSCQCWGWNPGQECWITNMVGSISCTLLCFEAHVCNFSVTVTDVQPKVLLSCRFCQLSSHKTI